MILKRITGVKFSLTLKFQGGITLLSSFPLCQSGSSLFLVDLLDNLRRELQDILVVL